MPRAKKDTTTTKSTIKAKQTKGTKKVSKVLKGKTTAAETAKTQDNSFFITNFFSQITSKIGAFSKNGKLQQVQSNKRMVALLLLFLGILLISYFAYKGVVLGWVDYTPITRIQLYSQLEGRYGKEMKDQLVTEALILNESSRRGVRVSDEELGAEVKKIEDQQGGAEKLAQILELQGLSMDELKRQLKYRLMITKMFGENINISDEEINQYYTENKAAFNANSSQTNPDGSAVLGATQEASPTGQLKEEIKGQLKQQKLSDEYSKWLEQAKSSERVKI